MLFRTSSRCTCSAPCPVGSRLCFSGRCFFSVRCPPASRDITRPAGSECTAEIKQGRAHRDFVNSLLLSSQFRLPTHKASETRPPQTSPPRQEMRWWCPRTLPNFCFRCQMMRRQPQTGSPEPRRRAMLIHSPLRCAPRERLGRALRASGRVIQPHKHTDRCHFQCIYVILD